MSRDKVMADLAAAQSNLKTADLALLNATRAAFPKGSLVRSQIRSGVYVLCTVTGHGHSWHGKDYVQLLNITTHKAHSQHVSLIEFLEDAP